MAEKLYYSMGEVAEMLDVSHSLLRFWEKRFDIIAPNKNKKGNRLFSPEDVRNLKTIYHLVKERGMTLTGAEKLLRARRSEIERDMEIAERLGAIRALLVEVRNELGDGGIVVDDAVVEEVVPEIRPKPRQKPEQKQEPESEPEQEQETQSEPEQEQETQSEPEQEQETQSESESEPGTQPEPEPGPNPGYIEQTLF